jgi:hypothetical protein
LQQHHPKKPFSPQSLTQQIRVASAFAVIAAGALFTVPALASDPPPPPPPTCTAGTVCDDSWMYNN